MKYSFDIGTIIYPNGSKRIYPFVNIENSNNFGSFIDSEITHLGSNLDYVNEIVDKLESLLKGEMNFYEGFGFEVYMIACDRENAKVINIFEDDKIEAIIPTLEIYELMRDWRDYLEKYYLENKIQA